MGVDAYFANWRGFFGAPNLPQEKVDTFVKVLGDMYKTPEWETVRKRNGWGNLYKPGKEFEAFLLNQEKVISDLMKELGFL
jgi:putative tricarboxylic transport membrane protein